MTDPRPASAESGEDRVLTIPNVITVVRLSLLPVFLWLLFGRDDRASAAWLLAALGTTDFLDGYIARHFDQVSELGKVLDPIADRLLFFVGIGGILLDGSVPIWFAVAVLVREIGIAAATLVLAAMGASRIDVTWFGKAGAFGLMMAFPLFLASESSLDWPVALAWVTGLPALAFSYYSVVLYVPLARQALREGRAVSGAAA
ncbi:MAG: CDP-alcohol phosphatidyltransferase family protein [Acidimicrobiales bacterium]|nr:CDP-alcohol phosphatidyltransferase family protein [Acidimicrobiales bacterium]